MSHQLFTDLVNIAVREGYSDIHMTGAHPVVYRKNGVISFDKKNRWSPEAIDALVAGLLTPDQIQMLKHRLSVDLARTVHQTRIRINIFNTLRGLSLAIRLLPGKVPRLVDLNLHPSLRPFCQVKSGLILICGATGTGKSSTIAALLEEINESRATHIITLEDPVEYRFVSKRSFIEQRELGTNLPSFEQGLMDALREAPDVIVVGELREPRVMRLTLDAAASGHLVIASLHANSPEEALNRICNAFPIESQDEVRSQLATSLDVLLVQQLIYLERIGFRVPQLCVLRGTPAVKTLIRDNRFAQIESAIHTGRDGGMFTMESYRKDYIDRMSTFVSPQESFRPSEENTAEALHRSALVDAETAQAIFGPAPREADKTGARKTTPPPGKATEGEEGIQHYVIDENLTLEDLIAQIGTKDYA